MATRALQPMPDDICGALAEHGLADDYAQRPHYQRNDYLAWIARAKRSDTRDRRIAQMLHELRVGGVYMRMDHPQSART